MTRRSSLKITCPDIWSNSFCGHPSPGESFYDASERRTYEELAINLEGITPVLTQFRYSCEVHNGVRENEICPVFRARTAEDAQPNSAEVDIAIRMEFADAAAQSNISPWARLQMDELLKFRAPQEWPKGIWDSLPGTAVNW